jgi:hypothetical protein
MFDIDEKAEFLQPVLLQILKENPQGMSEYELIQTLRATVFHDFEENVFKDSHQLFIVHFILFHALYRLRASLWESHEGIIQISPLKIQITPILDTHGSSLAEHDSLSQYYLDGSNLDKTTRKDVDDLLQKFWHYLHAGSNKQAAMQVLEIDGVFNAEDLTRQYRKMVMKHHPDRGGDKVKLQQINEAMETLKHCL